MVLNFSRYRFGQVSTWLSSQGMSTLCDNIARELMRKGGLWPFDPMGIPLKIDWRCSFDACPLFLKPSNMCLSPFESLRVFKNSYSWIQNQNCQNMEKIILSSSSA